MRPLAIAALALSVISTAAQAASLNEVCQWRTRGIVAATPCMAQLQRQSASANQADGRPRAANEQRTNALRIETLGDRRRSNELSEEQATAELIKIMLEHGERLKTLDVEDNAEWNAERRREAARLYYLTRPRTITCMWGTCF